MSDRLPRASGLAPLLVLAVLGVAWMLPDGDATALAAPDDRASEAVTDALDGLAPDSLVLFGFDPDVGTYAEVRPTVRTLIADLLARNARIAFVSLTVEGRALASVEFARLQRVEADATRILDLGFVPGAEAGLVDLTRGIRTDDAVGGRAFARILAQDGIAAFDAIVVVGGNDMGPRSWIEQVAPRIDPVPILAVTPTILLPEVQPYAQSGQLAAVLGTPLDGATYRSTADVGRLERIIEPTEPRGLPVLVGMLLAILALGQVLVVRLMGSARALRDRDPG
ncbi:MAG: hypothetical protein ACR2K4_11200 [Candidatus Limnocylindria bacterium]